MSYSYVRWLFSKPLNSNFSFENDADSDGLADGLTDVSGTHTRSQDGIRFHLQKTTGEFYLEQVIDDSTDYRIYYDIKVDDGDTATITIKQYDSGDVLVGTFSTTNYTNSTWTYAEQAYTAVPDTVKLRIYVSVVGAASGDDGVVYLDNLSIIINATSVLINPTTFSYKLSARGEKIQNIDDNYQFIEPYKNKYTVDSITPLWMLIDYTYKAEIDALINEKILIRTHDREVFTAKVVGLAYTYKHYKHELEQNYMVEVQLEFF